MTKSTSRGFPRQTLLVFARMRHPRCKNLIVPLAAISRRVGDSEELWAQLVHATFNLLPDLDKGYGNETIITSLVHYYRRGGTDDMRIREIVRNRDEWACQMSLSTLSTSYKQISCIKKNRYGY